MSEVKKLYELVGIENYSIKGWTGFVPNKYKIIADDDDNVIDIVLDFTAEKQLELIKWLCDTDYYITEFCRLIDTREYYIETDYKHFQSSSFEETLAGLVNKLWQDLTEQERTEIRSILNG